MKSCNLIVYRAGECRYSFAEQLLHMCIARFALENNFLFLFERKRERFI